MLKNLVIIFMLTVVNANAKCISKIDQILQEHNYSGTILFANDKNLLCHNAYGFANQEKKIKNAINTIFPIASVTKTLTSAVLLKILNENKISVDRPISDYLDLPSDISIKSLLNHTSGLTLYTDFNIPSKQRTKNLNKEEFYNLMLENREVPGAFNYNNGNYIILEHLIEKLTNKNYSDVLKENIFVPLKMKHSGVVNNTQAHNMAIGYNKAGKPAYPIDYSWLGGGAGLYSTVNDLYKFASVLVHNKIISKQLLDHAFTDYGNHYGYGWTLNNDIKLHEGGIDGFSTMLMLEPDSKRILVMLSNKEIDIDSLSKEIFNLEVSK